MTLQFSTTLRTNRIGQLQTTIGGLAILKLFSGAEPANCAASDPSGPLITITLPASFLTSASGVATKAGTWAGTASAAGVAASFRIYDGSAVCHAQGAVAQTGTGSVEMYLDNTNIATSQSVTVSTATFTDNNS